LGVGIGLERNPSWKRSPNLRRYNAMITHDATRCVACGSALHGKQTRFCSRVCKNHYSYGFYASQKSRGLRRKQQLVRMLAGRCAVCGYDRCLSALSFHHKDPTQKRFPLDMRHLTNRKWEAILIEARKCTLLCLNCHAETHHPQVPCSAVEL